MLLHERERERERDQRWLLLLLLLLLVSSLSLFFGLVAISWCNQRPFVRALVLAPPIRYGVLLRLVLDRLLSVFLPANQRSPNAPLYFLPFVHKPVVRIFLVPPPPLPSHVLLCVLCGASPPPFCICLVDTPAHIQVRRPRTYSAFQPPIRIHTVSKEHQYNKQDKPEKEGLLCLGNDKKEQQEDRLKQGDGITNLELGTVIDLTGEDGRMSVASALSTSSSVSSSSSSSSVYDLEQDFDDYEGEDDGDDDHENQNADEVVSTGSAYDTEDEEIKQACENGVSMCFSSDDSDSEDDDDEDEESQMDGHRTIFDSSLSTPRTRARYVL